MKQVIKITISLLLLLAIVFSFASCELLPFDTSSNKGKDGYTGGFRRERHYYIGKEIHWVETYEEAMVAIEHLTAAGNKIPLSILSSFENDTVDAKYCFVLSVASAKRLKNGEQWYDRKGARVVSVRYYGFLDNVTIDQLEFSYIEDYRCFSVSKGEKHEIPSVDEMSYICNSYTEECCAVVKGSETSFAKMQYNNIAHWVALGDDFHNEFIKTLVYLGE